MWPLSRFIVSSTLRRSAVKCITEHQQNQIVMTRELLAHFLPVVYTSRSYSQRKGFLESLMDNIKQEYNKDTELKETIAKFRKEAQELEDSDALKQARQKFKDIEKEAIPEALGKVKSKISETAEGFGKTEFGKAAGKFTEGLSGAAKQAADSETLKKAQSILTKIAEGSGVAPDSLYKRPAKLRKRNDNPFGEVEREFEANTDATNVVMHKDSVWNQQWESFKNSKVGERISDMKMQFDESDNVFIRGSRFVTDKISSIAGGMFGGTEISKIMTEIVKTDPNFSAQEFIEFCKNDIIPNMMEAIAQNDEEIIKDWCSEAPYNQIIFPVKQAEQIGCQYELATIDVDHVDIAGATKVDQGPVLVISFQTQQIMVVRDKKGIVVEGDENQVMRVYHVWALCRDVEEMDPRAAWKIIDQSMSASPMLL
uniref:Mitochondrial import inner membrane translocase subunit TIM44 n=1 Tax=Phallusia mammillata TaxID=59560 RepID=A0A6F9DU51_9ASCI|nr:mitochondrial import inner membrane translocase subunit TIM44 [Phallusia mammillata]